MVYTKGTNYRTVYPLDGLRRACPCATCQGHENMRPCTDQR